MRLAITTIIATLAGSPAIANDAPWLARPYGNEPGCAFGKGGTRDNESMQLLTAEGYEDYVTSCSFVQVLKGNGAYVITALCGHEGEDLITAEMLVIRPPTDGDGTKLMLTDANGNIRAEVEPCK